MTPRLLDGKLAIITGASRGIGAAIAQNLASKGCSLILNYSSDKSKPQCAALAIDLEAQYSIRCIGVQADMGSASGPSQLIQTAQEQFQDMQGGQFQINIIINNAGVVNNASIEHVKQADFDWMYHTNVLGPLLLIQAALPYLPLNRGGRIINVSSISSTEGFIGQTIYGGTKAALESMTRTWARELAERCTVNAINPGPVMTDMWTGMPQSHKAGLKPWVSHSPLAAIRPEIDDHVLVKDAEVVGGRPAYPHEVAGIVGMMCSEDSSLCTGQVICANGGMRMAI